PRHGRRSRPLRWRRHLPSRMRAAWSSGRENGTLASVADATRLVVVSCRSQPDAAEALHALRERDTHVADSVVVTRSENGRVELHQTHQIAAGEGVVAGGTVGFVAGMLLGGPVGGALLGMLGGGILGARDTGVPDERLRGLGDSLTPGAALLCVLVADDDTA